MSRGRSRSTTAQNRSCARERQRIGRSLAHAQRYAAGARAVSRRAARPAALPSSAPTASPCSARTSACRRHRSRDRVPCRHRAPPAPAAARSRRARDRASRRALGGRPSFVPSLDRGRERRRHRAPPASPPVSTHLNPAKPSLPAGPPRRQGPGRRARSRTCFGTPSRSGHEATICSRATVICHRAPPSPFEFGAPLDGTMAFVVFETRQRATAFGSCREWLRRQPYRTGIGPP
jgi:hypothetical protein